MIKSRNTNQKQLILETISKMYHPSAEEIYEEIRLKDLHVGRATIFRNVTSLTKEGKLIRIKMPHGADRFETMTDLHSHFVCDCCGKVYDLISDNKIKFPQNTKHNITDYVLTYMGVCEECQKKNGGN